MMKKLISLTVLALFVSFTFVPFADGAFAQADDPLPTISVSDVTVWEDFEVLSEGACAIFTVKLSSSSSSPVTVDYSTADGTATAGSDYTATSGTLPFAAGETTGTISVPIIEDYIYEGHPETFYINLENPTNATTSDYQGIGVINDDMFGLIRLESNGHYYEIIFVTDPPQGLVFPEASYRAECWSSFHGIQGHLATIRDVYEQMLINDLRLELPRDENTTCPCWIGLYRQSHDSPWWWVTGEPGPTEGDFQFWYGAEGEGAPGNIDEWYTLMRTWDGDTSGRWESTGNGVEVYINAYAVEYPDPPPTADAGQGQSVTAGTLVTLDGGSSSDLDGDYPLTFSWEISGAPGGSTAALDDPGSATPCFTPDLPGTYVITLVVADSYGASSEPDQVTVEAVNQPPVADAGGPYFCLVGTPVIFDGSGSSDSDGTIVKYEWDFGDGSTGTGATPTHTYTTLGLYTVILTVTDDGSATDTANTEAYVEHINRPPVAADDAYDALEDSPFSSYFSVLDNDSDADGDPLTAVLVNGSSNGALALFPNGEFDYIPNPNFFGIDSFTYKANDGIDDSNVATVTITVNAVNDAPVADAGEPYEVDEGSTFTLDGSGSFDPDGTIVSYQWDFGDGDTGSGANPTHTYADDGTYTVTLTVTDDDTDSQTDTTQVTVQNVAPTLSSLAATDVDEGGTSTLSGNIFDPGILDTFMLSVDWGDGSPVEQFVYSAGTTSFTETYTYGENGAYSIMLMLEDDDLGADTQTTSVNVNDLGPMAVLTGDTLLDESQTGSYDASGSTSSPDAIVLYEWDWDYDGCTFNPSGDTGAVQTHAWNDDGTYTVAVRVTDDDGSTDISTLSITIENPPPEVMVENLSDEIDAMENLPASIKNSLHASLDTAIKVLKDSNLKTTWLL